MKYYGSPRWSAEIADCSMPMTFDTYSNCSFGCLYCFSQFQRAVGKAKADYLKKVAFGVNVDKVKEMFTDPEKNGGQFATYIKQRRVMQWGGLSDQFDGNERVQGKTLELLKFFKEINYPLCFSTKATWWTKDERYMELFRGQKNWNVKFSIITLDEEKARAIEKGVPTPIERLEAMKRVSEAGAGGTTLRLRPFIIGVSSPSYTELIKRSSDSGATAVSTEFMCVDIRSKTLRGYMPELNKQCGYDVLRFYREYSTGPGYLRLNRKIKYPYIKNMKELCDGLGMRFYVSDAHFKEMCCNGSCCGLPEDWNYSRGQFCEALQIAKRKGTVTWQDIRKDIYELHGDYLWRSANGYNTASSEKRAHFRGVSMAEYIRWLWNNPQSANGPYRMFGGVLRPISKDIEGNFIYAYDESETIKE